MSRDRFASCTSLLLSVAAPPYLALVVAVQVGTTSRVRDVRRDPSVALGRDSFFPLFFPPRKHASPLSRMCAHSFLFKDFRWSCGGLGRGLMHTFVPVTFYICGLGCVKMGWVAFLFVFFRILLLSRQTMIQMNCVAQK